MTTHEMIDILEGIIRDKRKPNGQPPAARRFGR